MTSLLAQQAPISDPPIPVRKTAPPIPVDIDQILRERGGSTGPHGEASMQFECAQRIKDLYRSFPGWEKLTPLMKEALEMDAMKVSRILCGRPHYKDHWTDRAGYAKIVADRLPD
jgi:hypothetical protein